MTSLPRIPLTITVCQIIRDTGFKFLKNHILNNYYKYLEGNNIVDKQNWINSKNEWFVWNFADPIHIDQINDGKIINTILGVSNNYLWKLVSNAKKSAPNPIKVNGEDLKILFGKLGYDIRKDFLLTLLGYIHNLELPPTEKATQEQLILKLIHIERERETPDWEKQTVIENFTNRLTSTTASSKSTVLPTKWWMYFYGYSLGKEKKNNPETWNLVRLLLTFNRSRNRKTKDLIVSITNTNNSQHYNYYGETDFQSSTNKVLVINMKTATKPKRRQLNIKLFIDGANGSFYMGQYLNYEVNKGRIISGIIILEMTKEENPIPKTFSIPKSGGNSDENREIEHIIPFFKDLSQAFRETPTIIFSPILKK